MSDWKGIDTARGQRSCFKFSAVLRKRALHNATNQQAYFPFFSPAFSHFISCGLKCLSESRRQKGADLLEACPRRARVFLSQWAGTGPRGPSAPSRPAVFPSELWELGHVGARGLYMSPLNVVTNSPGFQGPNTSLIVFRLPVVLGGGGAFLELMGGPQFYPFCGPILTVASPRSPSLHSSVSVGRWRW